MIGHSNSHSAIILITGGAGFIGSHVNKMLHQRGFQTIVFDNLSQGNREAACYGTFIKGDLANEDDIESVFNHFSIDAVMHFAALIDVGESVEDPAKYYINNVINTIHLLEAMRRHAVGKLVFSSSAAVYGIPHRKQLSEDHPCRPINPYGRTKLMIEDILRDYDNAYGLKAICLRYFNAAGGDPEGVIKNYKSKESNLIPLILRSLLQPKGALAIYGTDYPTPDGTCIRDYIHIEDLGSAHILAFQKLMEGGDSTAYNLGNGNGFSVREIIRAAETVTDLEVNTIDSARRPGDIPVLVANSQKAQQELGWRTQYSAIETIIAHAWQALLGA